MTLATFGHKTHNEEKQSKHATQNIKKMSNTDATEKNEVFPDVLQWLEVLVSYRTHSVLLIVKSCRVLSMITKNIYVKGKRYIAIWEMHLSWRSTSSWCRLIFLSEDFNLGATLPFLSSYIVTIIFWFISDFHYNGFIVTILTDQPNIYTYYMKVNQVRNNAISIITFPFSMFVEVT